MHCCLRTSPDSITKLDRRSKVRPPSPPHIHASHFNYQATESTTYCYRSKPPSPPPFLLQCNQSGTKEVWPNGCWCATTQDKSVKDTRAGRRVCQLLSMAGSIMSFRCCGRRPSRPPAERAGKDYMALMTSSSDLEAV